MKSATAFGVLALVAGAVAHEHQHEKFHQQRAAQDACSVAVSTITSYGEWGLVPETKSAAPSSTSSSSSSSTSSNSSTSSSISSSSSSSTSSAPPPSPSSTSSAAPPPPAYTSSSSSEPAPPAYTPETTSAVQAPQYKAAIATTEAAPATTSAAPAKSTGTSGSIIPNGNKWAFCYTPYTSSGGCKSASDVNSDIASLKGKGFTSIRTYANDCNGLNNIGAAARTNGMKLLVGINIDATGISSYASGQVDALVSWAQWDLVEMVVVGNEAVFNGWTDAGSLAGFITSTKSKLGGAGYSGPVTTTEPLNIIEQYGSTICPVVDVIGANIHPFFNSDVSALLAGPFVASQLVDLAGVCGNSKPAYILETGWPSAGSSDNGLAVPGIDTQSIAISGIMAAVGGKAAVFSYLDDHWKAPGQYGVEQHWGCANLF